MIILNYDHGVNEIQYDKMLYIDVQVPRYEENVRGEEMKKLRSDIRPF